MLLGHRHAGEQPGFGEWRAQPRVVGRRSEAGLEFGGQVRRMPEGGQHRVGHGDRATVTGLDLRPQVEPSSAHNVPAAGPGRGVQPVPHRCPQQFVPGGMELDLVDAVAEPVMRAQLGWVAVREPSPLCGLRRPRLGAKLIQLLGLARLEARCHQERVRREPVHVRQPRWHVLDFVRRHGPQCAQAAKDTPRGGQIAAPRGVGQGPPSQLVEESSVSWWRSRGSPRPCWSCRLGCR